MANIDIKFSQSIVDQNEEDSHDTLSNGEIGALVDSLISASYAIGKEYLYYSSWSWAGSTLRINFNDGATKIYTGVVLNTPGATQGLATASGFEFYNNGVLSIAQAGRFELNYAISNNGNDLSVNTDGGTSVLNLYRFATLFPTNSPYYSADTGNVAVVLNGAVTSSPTGALGGTLSKITGTADKFLQSVTIDGNFQVSGNTLQIGQSLSHSAVSGTLTGYNEIFRDGSHVSVTDVSTFIGPNQMLDQSLLADGSRFSGNDVIRIELPAHLYADFVMASGSGDDKVTLIGGGGRLHLDAGSGNDSISVLSDAHQVDGGAGMDTVAFSKARSGYSIVQAGKGFTITDNTGAVNTFTNIERIEFSDASVALDIGGSGGQAYRLYQAAFNRAPDAGGLGFQMWAMDTVGWSLPQVAQGFIDSPEFIGTYGKLSNHDFVVQLYANVLHRAPDAGGLKFHTDLLDAGTITRAADLVGFSESPENQAALIGVIGNGFSYIPYHG